jgi:hydrogenase expression/formation protein HypE
MAEILSMSHGAGGEDMHYLLKEVILKKIKNRKISGGLGLDELDDSGTVPFNGEYLVFTTDSYVVKPFFFPGGDIGRLAVCGTINDICVMGANPLTISLSLIIPEGFRKKDLEKILNSIDSTSQEVGVPIITGDTKVVEKESLDSIIINTSGLGLTDHVICDSGLQVGDKIIISGTLGDHGISLLAFREGLDFEVKLTSDVAPMKELIFKALSIGKINAMKDPTRGGLANSLNELAEKSQVCIKIFEDKLPFNPGVKAAAEMLGIDPLHVANEGKVVLGVSNELAEEILKAIKKTKYGKHAEIIGEVISDPPGKVFMETIVGGERLVEKPIGDPIPRVC